MATHRNAQGDALAVLHKDHQAIEELFHRFERSHAASEREKLAAKIVRELSIHTAIEEVLVYPAIRRRANGATAERVLKALEEHHLAKLELAEIERLDATDERFAVKVGVLAEGVRRHVQEEERDLFPAARRAISPEELRDLGDALLRAKERAPTRPHPLAPDQPPANALTVVGVAYYDRGREAIGRGIQRVIYRSRDVVEQALHRGEVAAREARKRLGRGIERGGREVRTDAH